MPNLEKLNHEISDIHRDLVERSRSGDPAAQKELYIKYSKAMFNICVRMLRNRTDAEDALQDAFVDAFTKLNSYRGEATFGAWLKRIVINHCINKLKRQQIEWTDLETKSYKLAAVEQDQGDESRYDMRIVQKGIQALPDGYRTVFTLYAVEGYDHQEISEILGISESTSKSQYLRAKQKIKAFIQDFR